MVTICKCKLYDKLEQLIFMKSIKSFAYIENCFLQFVKDLFCCLIGYHKMRLISALLN